MLDPDDVSKYAEDLAELYQDAFRLGGLAALEEFGDRFKTDLQAIQASWKSKNFLVRTALELPNDIVTAAGTILKEMKKERE